MQLRSFGVERYKGYVRPAEVELAPLTILVGANNAGKTALAQAIQLLAGGLASLEQDASEPLPLMSGDIRHGETFEDLVAGRMMHGWLSLSATLEENGRAMSLSATVRNVVAPNRPSERQISTWSLRNDRDEVTLEREGFDKFSSYNIRISGIDQAPHRIEWDGLIPRQPDVLAGWVAPQVDALKSWATGVRHLRCPRTLLSSPFPSVERSPDMIGSNGEMTPLVLSADDALRENVREWYFKAFGISIDVVAQGSYSELVVRIPSRDTSVPLVQSGRGLSHVLPVAVTALTSRDLGPGVDIIEHPEAELHPAAHSEIAELLLANLAGRIRPLVVETHSDMILLRARRWVAEEKMAPNDVLVYWINTEPSQGSVLQKIKILESGEMDNWPDGVFIEDYEEILAIRRAARPAD